MASGSHCEMGRTKGMFFDDGRYNFQKKEEYDYHHSYDYMSGWLGQDIAVEEFKKKKLLGKVDLPVVATPMDAEFAQRIDKTAGFVFKAQDPASFEEMVKKKNENNTQFRFLTEGREGNQYYKFVRHCLERKVDWKPLCDKAAVEAQKTRKEKDMAEMKRIEAGRAARQPGSSSGAVSSSAAPSPAPVPASAPAPNPVQQKSAQKRLTGLKEDGTPDDSLAFAIGTLVETVGLEKRPDMNGHTARVIGFHGTKGDGRYEVKFEEGRYIDTNVKLKPENLMYSQKNERDLKKQVVPEGEIPNKTRIEIHSLQSEGARWLNGQKGTIVQWDKEVSRYEVRLDVNNHIKKVTPKNVKVEVPEGWTEHYDEHLQRHYYVRKKDGKVTWNHPTVSNLKGKFGKVVENAAGEMEDVEVDHQRQHYDCDDQEEGTGGFNLDDLINKVEEQESRREAGEEVDEFEHAPKKKNNKKRKRETPVTPEDVVKKVTKLKADSLTRGRSTLMPNNLENITPAFIAVTFVDVYAVPLEKHKVDSENGIYEPPSEKVIMAGVEGIINGLDKASVMVSELVKSKHILAAFDRLCDKVNDWQMREMLRLQRLAVVNAPGEDEAPAPTPIDPFEVLEEIKWISSLLKTF